MNSKKILNNIVPFNDIWYRDCYYSALFPVVNYYKLSIIPLIVNDVNLYQYNLDSELFDIKSVNIRNEEEIIKDLGIIAKYKLRNNGLLSDIKNSINEDMPIIVLIDPYYESIREDAYMKEHFPHFILVYGYDNLDQNLYILEHQYRESNIFEYKKISYSDIMNSYEGVFLHLKKVEGIPTYREYGILKNIGKKDNCTDVFKNNLSNIMVDINLGLKEFDVFLNKYSEFIINENWISNNVDFFIDRLNKMINYKKVEKYRLIRICYSIPEIINIIDDIITNLNIIRGVISKYKFSLVYNQKSLIFTYNKLKDVSITEKKYYDSLFDFLFI